ncbi:calcium permeable stress-gated cation channel 1-like isoform X3 [Mercenaria mercenaria]|uniref:calcium permeable stress-gated cation channel 1-like isoform X3 n=1 Tax=Mercenaria mercenaria TaxID=6596 RepID=UPI00234FABA3|nr:calcium permeable stress-gated cation channel 1-like isoform X3 [Mercenaria mercenaria]
MDLLQNSSFSDDTSCLLPQVTGNKTHFIAEGSLYGGIPENLTINAIVWVVLLILFAVLRRVAWDYGRIALVSRQEENQELSPRASEENKYNVWTSLFYGEHEGNRLHGSMESLDSQLHAQDRGFCSWITAFVRVKDSDIVKKCGQDALQYITFQRYILLYVLVVCVLSTAIIIPVNFTGTYIGNATDFGHTTIANLDAKSNLLWIHAILAVVFLVLAVIFMRHFSVNLTFDDDEQVSKTLMIANIPTDKCYRNVIMQHFQEGYPEVHVQDVQFAYDVERLMELDTKRAAAKEARMNSEIELQKTGHRPTVKPYTCGQCLFCAESCGCVELDAITYYGDEENRLAEECEKEKVNAYKSSLGVGFVTFENVTMAERIRKDFVPTCSNILETKQFYRIMNDFQPSCKASQNPQPSSIHVELNVVEWEVTYAPSPENIYWQKLSLSGWKWWLKAILINSFVVILLFFLTTPSIILTNLDKLSYKDYIDKTHSALLVQFLPTLLLWTFTALLPNIVYWSDQYVGHWTRSSEHHAVMLKTFIFLLLMVLILPSLGLTSAKALFDIFVLEKGKTTKWNCIFLAGNGAFFVNYVITSAFIGTALELLRFSELFLYGIKLLMAKSSAERTSVRKHVLWEFQYGMEYAWFLCVFAILMSYSLSCPLIMPFGLVYMIFKHIVDRYNIYFAYKPSRISSHIHWTAINFVIVSVIFLQFNFVFFSVLRGSSEQPISIFSIVVLFFTLLLFFGRVCFGCFRSSSPFKANKYKQFDDQAPNRSDSNQQFVASVLSGSQPRPKSSGMSATDTLTQSYGTMDATREPHSYGAMDTTRDAGNETRTQDDRDEIMQYQQ